MRMFYTTTLDRILQLGWRNRCGEVHKATAQMVRDEFVVANLMVKDAISQIDLIVHNENECGENMEADVHYSISLSTKGNIDTRGSEEHSASRNIDGQ